MSPEFSSSRLNGLLLEPHPHAREKVLAASSFAPGTTILSIPACTSVLLPSEKARRCDACHRFPPSAPLRKCSGCAAYFYCDATCQALDWGSQHKRICRRYNRYIASESYQAMAAHERMDALLLSHLVAYISCLESPIEDESSPIYTFLSLLRGPVDVTVPSLCYETSAVSRELALELYSRFGNNNFAMHSHLNTYGHGIFPLASRLFNHSCVPNAAVKYITTSAQRVQMEVVALRPILPNEEICLPYLDPALTQTRQQIFEITYGFKCRCASCIFLESIGHIPDIPGDADALSEVTRMLHEYMAVEPVTGLTVAQATKPLPAQLYCVFNESYISMLSEKFSKASHDGPYDVALEAGTALLDVYRLIYPPNYPQIGMHLLEMAKTSWNVIIKENLEESAEAQVRSYLTKARDILLVLGPEGDEGGPLQEIQTLGGLLASPL